MITLSDYLVVEMFRGRRPRLLWLKAWWVMLFSQDGRACVGLFRLSQAVHRAGWRRPAKSIEYLTSDPTPDQIESATFVAVITGSIRGNQMSLKVQPAGVDYSGRVTGKLAAVVIPMASPVPLVQTFDVVFQGGVWQLTRAIGPSGATERPLTITSGGGKRLVQADIPRQLSTAGARGAFTTRIQLCAGCGS